MTEYDLQTPFIERHCFGIPVRRWITILAAINVDIAKARATCGGDGLGCAESFWHCDVNGRRYRKCGQCPMDVLANLREAVNDYL